MKSIDVKALYRSCNVLYVYHNVIDAHGDSDKTEDEVFDSCETAFRELTDVVKKLAGGNVNNMIITSDHGFLYQASIWTIPNGSARSRRETRYGSRRGVSPSARGSRRIARSSRSPPHRRDWTIRTARA